LIRVHRFQSGRVLEATNNILLSQLKWPIETMYIGLRPAQNVAATNPNQYRDWHNLTLLTDQQLDCAAAAQGEVMTDDLVAFNAVSIKHKYFTSRENNCAVVFPNSTETVDTLQLQAHGIQIFATTRSAFYRDYLPYTFGGSNINTPEDKGGYMLNFCLYPGTYQPLIWGLRVCNKLHASKMDNLNQNYHFARFSICGNFLKSLVRLIVRKDNICSRETCLESLKSKELDNPQPSLRIYCENYSERVNAVQRLNVNREFLLLKI
jgi:hypothetical protein